MRAHCPRQHTGPVHVRPHRHISRERGPRASTGRHRSDMRCAHALLPEQKPMRRGHLDMGPRLFHGHFVPSVGRRWNLHAGAGLAAHIQEGGPLAGYSHHGGRGDAGVRPGPLEHAGGGPVVEGQLLGAVTTHTDPQGPHQHRYAR